MIKDESLVYAKEIVEKDKVINTDATKHILSSKYLETKKIDIQEKDIRNIF